METLVFDMSKQNSCYKFYQYKKLSSFGLADFLIVIILDILMSMSYPFQVLQDRILEFKLIAPKST